MKENSINEDSGFLFVGKHPKRDCTYKEAIECIKLKKDTPDHINPQMEQYRSEGFPENFGLPQSCIVFRYHNTEASKSFGEHWFEEIKNKSHRDQLSFSYVAWKDNVKGIVYLPSGIFDCSTFRWNMIHFFKKQTTNTYRTPTTRHIQQTPRPEPNKNLTEKVKKILEERKKRRINAMTL